MDHENDNDGDGDTLHRLRSHCVLQLRDVGTPTWDPRRSAIPAFRGVSFWPAIETKNELPLDSADALSELEAVQIHRLEQTNALGSRHAQQISKLPSRLSEAPERRHQCGAEWSDTEDMTEYK